MSKNLKFTAVLIFLLAHSNLSFATVLGELQRFQAKDSTVYPYNTVGQINEFCTGTLIASNKVLTAAHCLYNTETQSLMNVDTFYLARNGIAQAGVAIEVKSIAPHPIFVETGLEYYDLGVITLKQNVNLPVMPVRFNMESWTLDTKDLTYRTIGSIMGYPGDKLLGTMWFVVCNFERQLSNFYRPHYTCDTFGGMSGSALVLSDENGYYISGVHTNGGSYNSGLFIIDDVQNFVMRELNRL